MKKNSSIELLKFFALLFVLNSHMDVLYGKYNFLATGGAIGDCLFFFASGYTIFIGRFDKFDNWYKRRVKRIYPTIIAWAGILSFLGVKQIPISQIVIGSGFWFISCIMLYYIVLYFVRKYFAMKPLKPFATLSIITLIWYCYEDSSFMFMFGETYFKWLHYFFFMLAGAYVGNSTFKFMSKPFRDSLMLFSSIILFYGIQLMTLRSSLIVHFQIVTLIPLMGIVIYIYKLCCSDSAKKTMNTRYGYVFRFFAGLCLEVYIVQSLLINYMNGKMSSLFPVNLTVTIMLIMLAAYMLRCCGRFVSQLFEKNNFDWKSIVRLVD